MLHCADKDGEDRDGLTFVEVISLVAHFSVV